MAEAAAPWPCPVCGAETARVYTVPRFLFKADPRDVRPIWHNHERLVDAVDAAARAL